MPGTAEAYINKRSESLQVDLRVKSGGKLDLDHFADSSAINL